MNPLAQLLQFLKQLNASGVGYLLASDDETIMVLIRTDSGMREIAFYGDGAVEVQTLEAGEEPERVTIEDLMADDAFKG